MAVIVAEILSIESTAIRHEVRMLEVCQRTTFVVDSFGIAWLIRLTISR